MGKRGKTQTHGQKIYWQSADLNARYAQFFKKQLIQLALARFRWTGLPDTCNARYLETQLLFQGVATIAYPKAQPNLWLSLKCTMGGINAYGEPSFWQALGDNGTNFRCTSENGVVIFDNMLIGSALIGDFALLAYDMADIMRTKQINRIHSKIPFILKGDQQYRQQMLNLYKQIMGNEPGVIATKSFNNIDVDAIQTGVQYIGDKLQEDLQASWNMAFTYLGISNLPFKSERQTADEIRDYGEPTDLLSLNALQMRRRACEQLNERFGLDVRVDWNSDFESRSFNFENDLSATEGDEDADRSV